MEIVLRKVVRGAKEDRKAYKCRFCDFCMGGKRLKFPTRGKYVPPIEKVEMKENSVDEEEHKKRVEMLKQLGLLKGKE